MRLRSSRLTTAALLAAAASLFTPGARADNAEPQHFIDLYQPLNLMQVVNPGDKAASSAASSKTGAQSNALPGGGQHVRTFEMPPVTVVGEAPAAIREEDRIGSYGQPRWTADRRFPGTRVYVVPEGKIEFEYWLRAEVPRHGGDSEYRQLYELEIGLPHRFQLDLYFRTDSESGNDKETLIGQQFEIRYALADWGKIWGNPTLYAEYALLEQRPDKFEVKLLLGDELAPRWHWGANFVFETEISGPEREHEWAATGGISYTLIDSKLNVGAEVEAAFTDVKGDRGNFSNNIVVGPSIQWRPLPQMHVDFAPLFGVSGDSLAAKVYLVIGYEF